MLSKYTDNIYPTDLEIKDTTDAARSAQYIDIHNEIDREDRLTTKLYDKKKKLFKLFPLGMFYTCVTQFQQHLHVAYDIPKLLVPIRIEGSNKEATEPKIPIG
jgi:hypothetical protein